jgi:ABC-type multidrug transport system fused ATPase/permease subunit
MLLYFKKIWYILGDSTKQVPLLLFVFLVSSLIEALGIGLLGPFFIIVSNPDTIHENESLNHVIHLLGITSQRTLIIATCSIIVSVFILKSILYLLSKFYILSFSFKHRGKIVKKLNRAYLEGQYDYFISESFANLTKNTLFESSNFCRNLLLPLLYGVSNLFILICLFVLMAKTDLVLLIGTLISLLPVFLLVYVLKDRLRQWGKDASEATRKITQTLNHGLGGFKETRIIGCASYFESQMSTHANQHAKAASLTGSFEMLPRIMLETTLVVFIVSFIGIAQFLPSRNFDLLVSSLSIFAVSSIRLLPAASQVIGLLGNIQGTKHTVDILYSDLKKADQQLKKSRFEINHNSFYFASDSANIFNFEDKIQLKNIYYRYKNSLEPSVKGISLSVSKGKSIALIGKSGAGKTTLLDIILGLLNPQEGDIKVDGQSIYTNLRAWQNLIGYIPQSIFLMDDTIERNIAFGVPDPLIDAQRLKSAIAAAQLEELMDQLPNGIRTRVGERGVMLSGGQRQRIGIARALYHEREILVLDEATSALDNETEKLVTESIQSLSGEKTLIVVAHRLSTIKDCDQIFLLEKGEIVDSGTFQKIVALEALDANREDLLLNHE